MLCIRSETGLICTPKAIRTEQALSRCWQAKGLRMKALEHAELAYNICLKTLGEATPFMITSRLHMADALMLLYALLIYAFHQLYSLVRLPGF